ncbi:sensor histidine kinase [Kitasatospora sp. NPDC057223]|uniref:sensor histidine kinase n=1 Tax=Kitasatospora sp. NPDC057223 TaxID=3346055 RepID=UPI00363918F1
MALTAAALLPAAVAGPAAAARAAAAHQTLALAAVCAAVLLWCAAVGFAVAGTTRTRRLAARLAGHQDELAAAREAEAASRAQADEARAAAAAARTERDAALAETAGARAELRRARATAEDERTGRLELVRLADEILPALIGRLHAGASVDTVLAGHLGHPHLGLLRTVAQQVGHGERVRAAALAVCATAAGRVQALATSMHADLREMQHRHDEDVLGDLLKLDHATAQAGRMADSIAVLTGARSGRRWAKPIGVESVLRGALGRIGAYQRVRLHNASTAAVAGYAAEGVMHALAELLDNAANFSAPPAEVHVYVEEVHAGLVITVEDGGLGLGESWLRRAERAVSAEPLDLSTLSAGTRLGLAVVGSLARKHGLQISFRPSARGGTGVVMLIPEQLVSHPLPVPVPLRAQPVRELPGPGDDRPAGRETLLSTDDGLPQRRRGQTLAAAAARPGTSGGGAPVLTAAPAAPAAGGDAARAAARFGAFRKAVQAQPHSDDSPVSPKDDS